MAAAMSDDATQKGFDNPPAAPAFTSDATVGVQDAKPTAEPPVFLGPFKNGCGSHSNGHFASGVVAAVGAASNWIMAFASL